MVSMADFASVSVVRIEVRGMKRARVVCDKRAIVSS